ncbi:MULTISPECIES: amino acid ABC transporter permease [Corynebacterium]|uniref:Glutamate ABC transporter permease n=2 Tax=Corynebacterium TaxID=1716 RepID=A0ACC4U804_9CORY|nr:MULTISPECIES: amino acid ABC transporter permease [Corynebacterium]KKO77036.1 glutamate ABC transporter permease [Corynebacterium minutissimum]OFK64998.1 glutamate ABC transporter permease [Corynebacterium sp. HMSC074A09]OFK68626.1 glutamate ABC transporter permease [Corynebacterium sp. HMSC076G08]OFO98592.1 glutamate ABC transporter permease [Corynebacterium sp. HMSC034H07]OFP31520.1 glutamate ABC transporter permease [Corynebacterium sp. HMSC068G04]
MAVRATVLYDAPGPKGKRRNLIYTVITVVLSLAALYWVLSTLGERGQLDSALWTPFLNSQTWTTYLLPGLRGTILSAVASIILAIVFGVIFGLGRLSENVIVRGVCGVVVEFFRAIPVLLLMIFAYQLFAIYNVVPSKQLAFSAVVFALTLYNGSVVAEILRSGIKSLPKGQTEAARALGLSHGQTMRTILLPQAVAAMLPALIAQMVIALKDSALGYQIGYVEVVRSGIQSASYNKNYLASLIVVAIIMILINWGLGLLAERIERQLRAGRARRNIIAKVPEQPDQGLDTKDQVNVDWHSESYTEIRNPDE